MTPVKKVISIGLGLALAVAFGLPAVHGQLFVTNWNSGTVGEYTTTGETVNAALISGLSYPQAIVVSGGNLFITDFNQNNGTVGEYTTAGDPVNDALVTGLGSPPGGLALSGGSLFVDNYFSGSIGEYDAVTGAATQAPLIRGISPGMISVAGGELYEVNIRSKTIAAFTTAGATVNADLVNYGTGSPTGVAVYGGQLFLADGANGTISVYDANTGTVINPSLVSGLSSPNGIAVFGGYLFVANLGSGTIGEYDAATGTVVNAALITGLSGPFGIAVETLATTFVAAPTTFTYNGSAQGPALTPTPSGATYSVTSGTASASTAGNYSLTVTANGNYSGSQTFNWSIEAATPVLAYPAPAAITVGTAITAAQLDATANIPGTFTYALDGSPVTAGAGTLPTAGVHTLAATFLPTDTTDYTSATVSTSLAVNRVAATFSLSPKTFVYTGAAQGPTITPSPSGATFGVTSGTISATAAGSYSATVSANGNYSGSQALTWSIAPGAPALAYPVPAAIKGGTAVTAAQLDATANIPGTFTYTLDGSPVTAGGGTIPAAGVHTLTATFLPADATDYTAATISTTLTVNATATKFSPSPKAFVYNGTAQSPQVTATPSTATFAVTGTASATAVGTYSLTATATGGFTGAKTITWSIVKAEALLSFPTPKAIIYGTAVTAAQLDASANVPGVFTYRLGGKAIGAGDTIIPAAGPHRLVALFSPADSADYRKGRISAILTVNPAAATFSFSPGSFASDGSVHRPTITVSPAGVTFEVTGTESAKNPGTYSLTAKATGNYQGSKSFSWSIIKADH